MPNGGTTEQQINSLWKALEKKQDQEMCQLMHQSLQGDMGRLSSAIEKLTSKVEDLVTTTWKIRLKMVAILAVAGAGTGGISSLIFKLISG